MTSVLSSSPPVHPKRQIVYKVVIDLYEGLNYGISTFVTGDLQRKYRLNQLVLPVPNTYLFAYNRLATAQKMANTLFSNAPTAVLECLGVIACPGWMDNLHAVGLNHAKICFPNSAAFRSKLADCRKLPDLYVEAGLHSICCYWLKPLRVLPSEMPCQPRPSN